MDLAEVIAPDCEIEISGIRPGEKLHECLITEDEARHTKEYDRYFILEPEHLWWKDRCQEGTALSEGFRYSSDNNNDWLTQQQLAQLLR